MKCQSCGAEIPDNVRFCTNCGASIVPNQSETASTTNQFYGQPDPNMQGQFNGQPNPNMQGQFNGQPNPNMQGQFNGQPYGGAPMSKDEFYKHPALKKCRGNINGSAIIMYICAGITFIINVLVASNIFGLVDVFILVGLALGIQLGKSRVCAIISCVYAAFNVIYMIIATGSAGGYLVLIAAIYAIIATFQYHKAWDTYQKTGMLPVK